MKLSGILIPAVLVVVIGGGIGLADRALRGDKILLDRPEPPALPQQLPLTKPTETLGVPAGQTDPSGSNTVQPTPATPTADQKPKVTPTPPAAAELPKGHITIVQAKSLYDQPQPAFFVDARRKEVYAEGHVAGAFRADMASFSSGDPRWVSGLPKDMTLVVYCNGGDCDESEHVAQLLNASGFNAVYVMHDGFPGWKAAGHPIETGEGQE